MSIVGYKTAIKRNKLSSPTKWMIENIPELSDKSKRIIDYGCGRGEDADLNGWDKYDPYWHPEAHKGLYDIVVCNYVLCVMEPEQQTKVMAMIQRLLSPNGFCLISARRDIKWKQAGNGCTQRKVILTEEPLYEKSGAFAVWRLNKSQEIQAVGPMDTIGLKNIHNRLRA